MATTDINQEMLADIKRQYSSGSPTITMGGRTFNRTSSVIKRALTAPHSVQSLLTNQGSSYSPPTPNVPTSTIPGSSPTTGTSGMNVNVSPDTSPSQFNMALQNILQSRVTKSEAPYLTGGRTAMQGLLTLPEQLSSTKGWGGLNLSQARRLSTMEEAGLGSMYEGFSGALEGKRTRMKDLLDTATNAFTEARKAQAEAEGLNKEQVGMESNMRKEYIDSAKNYEAVRDSYGRIQASAINPSAAGDLSMIFNYMKMLDPGSVVRESEFANAAASGSFGEQIKGAVAKVVSGKRLSDDVRNDFIDRSNKLFTKTNEQHQQRISEYARLARNAGLDPSNIVIDLGLAGDQGMPTPSSGSNQFYALAADGYHGPYDLSNPQDVAEIAAGRADGTILN